MTIAPDGSANISVQTSTGVISLGPGTDIKVTEATSASPQQTQASSAAGQSSAYAKGDVNGDGKINSLDVLKLQRYLLNLETMSEKGKLAADLNGDGKVNSQDLLLLQKKILGL